MHAFSQTLLCQSSIRADVAFSLGLIQNCAWMRSDETFPFISGVSVSAVLEKAMTTASYLILDDLLTPLLVGPCCGLLRV